jgi:hypothetical protein
MMLSGSKAPSLSSILGVAALLCGAAFCYLRVAPLIERITGLLPADASDTLGLLPATGLAIARLLQYFTLGPASALSPLLHFLLSCWPVAILLLGAILLRKAFFPPTASLGDAGNRVPR